MAAATRQHALLSAAAAMLPVSTDPVRSLGTDGVARIPHALSAATAERLRAFVLAEIARLRADVEQRGVPTRKRFSQVLSVASRVRRAVARQRGGALAAGPELRGRFALRDWCRG